MGPPEGVASVCLTFARVHRGAEQVTGSEEGVTSTLSREGVGTVAEGGGTAEGAARAARWGDGGCGAPAGARGRAREAAGAGAGAGASEADSARDPPGRGGGVRGSLRSGKQVCKLKPSGERGGGRDPAVL